VSQNYGIETSWPRRDQLTYVLATSLSKVHFNIIAPSEFRHSKSGSSYV